MAAITLVQAIQIGIQIAIIAASITLSILNRPPGQDTEGTRLAERSVTTSTYGEPIPRIDGGVRIGANLIWATDIREVKLRRKQGGKGGKTSTHTEYQYFGDFAMAFCEGDGAGGISQIFADRKLIYDFTTDATVVIKYPGASVRTYMGSETQEPDPLIEADKGAGNVPPFRGLVYIVFEGLPLLDFGNRIPQIEAVVNTNAASVAPVKDDTTDAASGGSTGTWTLPVLRWRDVKYDPTTRQLYGITRPGPLYSVFRIDMEANEAQVALDLDSSNVFPSGGPAYDGGLFSSDATGGDLYPLKSNGAHGMRPHGVYPYTDGKCFVQGLVPDGADPPGAAALYAMVRVNPTTLRGITTAGSYDATDVIADALPRRSVSFTRAYPAGVSNYICLVHDRSFDGSNFALAVRIYDRDLEAFVGSSSITLGGVEQYQGLCTVVDRDGILYLFVEDHDAVSPGPNGENAYVFRLTVTRSFIGLNIVPELISLTNIGTGGGLAGVRCAAYDRTSHSIILCGGPDSANVLRWVRWDIDTETVVAEVTFDFTTTLGKQREIDNHNASSWSTNGPVNGFLYATMQGTVTQTVPAERMLKIRATDLSVEEVELPNHAPSNTFGEVQTMMDRTTNSVHFAPVSTSLSGLPQRIKYDRMIPTPVDLTTVLTRIFLDTGKLTAGDIDLTDADLTGLLVTGYLRGDRGSARGALQPLSVPFQFDVIETATASKSQLKVVVRGKTSIRSVVNDDLAATPNALQASGDRLVVDRSQENEVPVEVDFRYIDIDRDYQDGSQGTRRLATPTATSTSARQFSLQIPIVMTATQARRAAEAAMYSAWVSRTSYGVTLPPKHMDLDPSDLITVTRDSIAYLMRLARLEVGEGFSAIIGAESDDPESYISLAEGEGGQTIGQTFGAPGPTELFVLDIPLLRDVDDANQVGGGAYVGFGAYKTAWNTALAERSFDGGSQWDRWSLSRASAPWGWLNASVAAIPNDPDPEATASGTLARWPSQINTRDDVTTITIDMVQGTASLETITEIELFGQIGNGNVLIIGNGETAEVLKYRDVVDNGDGTVTIDTLLRGRRGTEEAARLGHLAGTRVIFVDEDVLNREGVDPERLTVTDLYRATSLGDLTESSAIQSLTWASNDNRPYPVSKPDTNSPRDGAVRGTVTVTWVKRTRVGGQRDLGDGIGAEIPLGESAESYEVDLIDSGLETVSATKTASGAGSDATGVQFTAAERSTASYADADAFRIKIYQMSGIVGRGLPRDVTI